MKKTKIFLLILLCSIALFSYELEYNYDFYNSYQNIDGKWGNNSRKVVKFGYIPISNITYGITKPWAFAKNVSLSFTYHESFHKF